MQRVLVLSYNLQPLMPCHPAKARMLLKRKRARVLRANPFTILLIEENQGVTQHAELNLDPGSKTTGIAYVVDCQNGRKVFFAAHLSHRGEDIKQALAQRRAIRRSRRARKTRYRQPRFNNRTRKSGWLPRLQRVLAQTKAPLKDAAAINAIRYRIGDELKKLGKPITFWTGGRTKYNRTLQNYPKTHWIDAACVGEKGEHVIIPSTLHPLLIQACGRGSRQMCRVDRFGFPRTSSKQKKVIFGFKTGDLVNAYVTKGKKMGTYRGRVAVRASGNFNVKTPVGTVQGINHRYCHLVQSADGYHYLRGSASSLC